MEQRPTKAEIEKRLIGFYTLDHTELDRMFRHRFGMSDNWSCAFCRGCVDGSHFIINALTGDSFPAKEMKAILENDYCNGYPVREEFNAPDIMLNLLALEGRIPHGYYLIRVFSEG